MILSKNPCRTRRHTELFTAAFTLVTVAFFAFATCAWRASAFFAFTAFASFTRHILYGKFIKAA